MGNLKKPQTQNNKNFKPFKEFNPQMSYGLMHDRCRILEKYPEESKRMFIFHLKYQLAIPIKTAHQEQNPEKDLDICTFIPRRHLTV